MRKYELLVVLPGTLDDKEVENRSAELAAMVKEYGTDVETHSLGKNRLAYPIKQIRYGYYFTFVFKAEAKQTEALRQKLSLTRDLLRFMVTYFNAHVTLPPRLTYTGVPEEGVAEAAKTEPASSMETVSVATAAAPSPEPKHEELNIEEINKKLDDLMSGDVVPGV